MTAAVWLILLAGAARAGERPAYSSELLAFRRDLAEVRVVPDLYLERLGHSSGCPDS